MGTLGKVKLAALETAGEDEIFGLIADGKNASDVIKHYNVGWNIFHKWIAAGEGRAQRYDEAKEMAAHYYASQAQKIADEIHQIEANVNSARLSVDVYKWKASKASPEYDVRQRDVAINISVNDLHAQAAMLLNSVVDDVIDAEVIDDAMIEDDEETDGV
tara:strand:+ start:884 stop:1363 length:480 start_codon:yes stop_codon:yes gene_type:complete